MKKLYALFLMVMFIGAKAQDVHFSQYWAAPVSMNPAQTGNFNGLIRGTFNYRNQWFLIPVLNSVAPYQTYQASVDAPIASERMGNNKLGVGLSFFNDRAGDGALTTNNIMGSVAYHQSLDRYGRSHLSFGLQAGLVMKRLNFNDLIFETQLDNYGWNKNIYNGEANASNKTIYYPDVNVGGMFSSRPKDRFAYNFGFALHHVAEPRESFLGDQNNRLGRRYVVHGGCDISVGRDNEWSILPTFLFMMQSNAQQYNVGVGVNYQANENIAIFGGGFYRVKDAVILNLGVDVYNARIGVSYDINHSDFRGASKAQGAVEVAIVYIFKRERDKAIQYPMYCPKF